METSAAVYQDIFDKVVGPLSYNSFQNVVGDSWCFQKDSAPKRCWSKMCLIFLKGWSDVLRVGISNPWISGFVDTSIRIHLKIPGF